MTDVLKSLRDAGYQPEIIEDSSFEAFKGHYICVVDEASRITGTAKNTGNPYDFISVKMKVAEVVDGDNAVNRRIDRNYNWDEAGLKKLLNDLHTAAIECTATSDEEIVAFLPMLKDKVVKVSAWASKEWTTKEGKVIPGGKQASRIVNKFKSKSDKSTEAVPF